MQRLSRLTKTELLQELLTADAVVITAAKTKPTAKQEARKYLSQVIAEIERRQRVEMN